VLREAIIKREAGGEPASEILIKNMLSAHDLNFD
jgi:hypothetical protein